MGSFGFGTTEKNDTTNVTTQNVATQSGIATGGSGNISYITTADPALLQSALTANAVVSGEALEGAFDFGKSALSSNTAVSKGAIDAINSNASLSILGANDLATKFATATSKSEADQISLLTELANANAGITNSALDKGFAVAQGAAPQTAAYASEQGANSVTKILQYFFIAGAVALVAYFFSRKS